MRKLILGVLLCCTSECYSQLNNTLNNVYSGKWKWEKNDLKHQFSLDIKQIDGFLIGRHCYILNAGDKMDCSVDKEDISFKVQITDQQIFITEIKSFNSGAIGLVEIKVVEKKLCWKLIKKPNDVYYLPLEAILIRK